MRRNLKPGPSSKRKPHNMHIPSPCFRSPAPPQVIQRYWRGAAGRLEAKMHRTAILTIQRWWKVRACKFKDGCLQGGWWVLARTKVGACKVDCGCLLVARCVLARWKVGKCSLADTLKFAELGGRWANTVQKIVTSVTAICAAGRWATAH